MSVLVSVLGSNVGRDWCVADAVWRIMGEGTLRLQVVMVEAVVRKNGREMSFAGIVLTMDKEILLVFHISYVRFL